MASMNDLDALKTHDHRRLRLLLCVCCLDPFIFSCGLLRGILRSSSALLSLGHSGEFRCRTGAYCKPLAPAKKDNDNHVGCQWVGGFYVIFRMSYSGNVYLLMYRKIPQDAPSYIKRRGFFS